MNIMEKPRRISNIMAPSSVYNTLEHHTSAVLGRGMVHYVKKVGYWLRTAHIEVVNAF
ncbi:MAG: hypothetical protein QXT53_06130 [Ignisphaera sp.]